MYGVISAVVLAAVGLTIIFLDRNFRLTSWVKRKVNPNSVDSKTVQRKIVDNLEQQQSFANQLYQSLILQNEKVRYVRGVASGVLAEMDEWINSSDPLTDKVVLRTVARERAMMESELGFYQQMEDDLAIMMSDAKGTASDCSAAFSVSSKQRVQKLEAVRTGTLVWRTACLLVICTLLGFMVHGFNGMQLDDVMASEVGDFEPFLVVSTDVSESQRTDFERVVLNTNTDNSVESEGEPVLDGTLPVEFFDVVVRVKGYLPTEATNSVPYTPEEYAAVVEQYIAEHGAPTLKLELYGVEQELSLDVNEVGADSDKTQSTGVYYMFADPTEE